MKRTIVLTLVVMVILLLAGSSGQGVQAQADSPQVLLLTASGPLSPVMQNYIQRGLTYARDDKMAAVVLQLNTPGGNITTMDGIIQDILASPVPVIVYVAPNGSVAASAGTLITLAGSLAAMAPETAIGAASPVGASGEDLGETMQAKVKEMLTAQARSLAERRGDRAVKLVQSAIESAKAATASEALKAGLVDYIAVDVPDLLRQADGASITLQGQSAVLKLTGAQVVPLNPSAVEQVLALLTDANLVFLLLVFGAWALLVEISSPGGWVAGFTGAVCVLLAVYGLGLLPVNWFGILFIVLAFVLFILDIKAPTHGALTTAGAASLAAGSLILFNSVRVPGFSGVSVPLVIGTSIFFAASFFVILTIALRAQRAPVLTGQRVMTGKTGVARSAINPRGTVQVGSEQWSAMLAEGESPIPAGEMVEVTETQGLRLIVRRAR